MENKIFDMNDSLSFKDDSNKKHGLRGHVQIFRQNEETGEKTLWYEDDNIIPISGYQWILMKMFGLYLDSNHGDKYADKSQDTTLVIPDLNSDTKLNIGIAEEGKDSYEPMESDISERHFVQGFLIGNGGAGEDAVTTKNTDYSFINLRNPIPFQQTQTSSLDPSIAGQYLGVYRQGSGSTVKSYYIKKFDERPHIYHNWWRDGQKWDYLDPVQPGDLGPDAQNGVGKTNRIETYAQVEMSVDVKNGDCLEYFNRVGNGQTAMINELGLVAFDTKQGQRSIIEALYKRAITKFIKLIFDNDRGDVDDEVISLASDIATILEPIKGLNQSNINNFIDLTEALSTATSGSIDYSSLQTALSEDTNIGVSAFYNQNGSFIYATDKFLEYLSADEFRDLSTDEAQRIKLVTYYTFNSIPLQTNWKILINYRIYAN